MNVDLKNVEVSKKWDHVKPFKDLVYNHDEVYIAFEYYRHVSEDGWGSIEMLIPNGNENGYTEIGICADGFVYDGDIYFQKAYITNNIGIKLIPTAKAIELMLYYRNMMKAMFDLNIILMTDLHLNYNARTTVEKNITI